MDDKTFKKNVKSYFISKDIKAKYGDILNARIAGLKGDDDKNLEYIVVELADGSTRKISPSLSNWYNDELKLKVEK